MNELNNTVSSVGNYNGIPTSLTSNTSVVNMVDGLTITKDADKKNWGSGDLTYTIVVENNADMTYEKPIVTDVIDTTYVNFVDGSVTIDGTPATELQYKYDQDSHTLTINLADIQPSTKTTLTFHITKKS